MPCCENPETSPSFAEDVCESLVADTLVPILSFLLAPSAANAGEIGAKITKAVTESELGIEVRRSVVRGAQLMVSYTGVG